MLSHRCLLFGVAGVALGLAANAYGQDLPPHATEAAVAYVADPTTLALLGLAKNGSLPAVLGGLGLWLGRLTQGGLKVAVRLDPADRAALADALSKKD